MFRYAFQSVSAVLTALYLLISVGACSVPIEDDAFVHTNEPTGESADVVSVNILQSVSEISHSLQLVTEEYTASTGGKVVFQTQTVPSREDYRATLRSKLLSGERVDLFHLLDTDDVDRLEDYLEDLSSIPWVSTAVKGTLDTVTVGGKLYGVPYSVEGIGLIVNRGIFAEAGISLEKIADFESMVEALEELQQAIGAGDLEDAYPELEAVVDLPAQDVEYLSLQIAELLLLDAFDSPIQARYATSVNLPSAEAAEGLIKTLARVSPQRASWTAFPDVTQYKAVEGGLAAGRVASLVQSTEIYRRVYEANPDMEGQLALLPLYYENYEQGVVFVGAPAWWAVAAGSSDEGKEAAIGLLNWLYQEEAGTEAFAGQFGAHSPYRATAEDTGLAVHSHLQAAIDGGLAAPRLAPEAPGGWGEQVFAGELKEYFTVLSKEWSQVVEHCKEEWQTRRDS